MEESLEVATNDTDEYAKNERLKGRNSEIWHLHLSGWAQERIGAKFGISQVRVSQILKQIRDSIPEATRQDMITTEVERLDYVLNKCWEVMERTHVVVSPSGRVAHEITEYALDENGDILINEHGHPVPKKMRKVIDDGPTLQAANAVMAAGRERRKIFGLDAATRTEVSGPGGDPIAVQVQEFANLPAEARRERLALLQEEVQRRARAAGDIEDDDEC